MQRKKSTIKHLDIFSPKVIFILQHIQQSIQSQQTQTSSLNHLKPPFNMQLTTITTAIAALAMGMGVSAAEPEAIQIKGTIFGDNQCSGKTSLGQFNITTVDATRCTTFTEHSNVEESAVHSIRIKSMNPKCSRKSLASKATITIWISTLKGCCSICLHWPVLSRLCPRDYSGQQLPPI